MALNYKALKYVARDLYGPITDKAIDIRRRVNLDTTHR